MASKADTWRRLHRLFRSPDTAYTQAIGEPGYAHTCTETERLLGYLMTVRMDGAPAFPG